MIKEEILTYNGVILDKLIRYYRNDVYIGYTGYDKNGIILEDGIINGSIRQHFDYIANEEKYYYYPTKATAFNITKDVLNNPNILESVALRKILYR